MESDLKILSISTHLPCILKGKNVINLISEKTYSNLLQFTVLHVPELRRLKKLEEEKRRLKHMSAELARPERNGETWSLAFISGVLTNKRKFRTCNVIDDKCRP